MSGEPTIVKKYMCEPDRDQPLKAAKIPLKRSDIVRDMQSVEQAEPDLGRMVDNYSPTVERTLRVIEAIEHRLQDTRREIDEVQARRRALAREYSRLGGSLVSASKNLGQQINCIISDLEAGIPTGEFTADTPLEKSQATAKSLAESMPDVGGAADLDLATSGLPRPNESLGNHTKTPEKT